MTILAYHAIARRDHPLAVDPDEFRRQLDTLTRFEVLSLRAPASTGPGR